VFINFPIELQVLLFPEQQQIVVLSALNLVLMRCQCLIDFNVEWIFLLGIGVLFLDLGRFFGEHPYSFIDMLLILMFSVDIHQFSEPLIFNRELLNHLIGLLLLQLGFFNCDLHDVVHVFKLGPQFHACINCSISFTHELINSFSIKLDQSLISFLFLILKLQLFVLIMQEHESSLQIICIVM